MNKIILDRKQQPQRSLTLNTKGCCFLCLQIINLKTEVSDEQNVSGSEPVSFICLHRYLKINTKQKQFALLNNKKTCDNGNCEEIKANLCKLCRRIIVNFSKWFGLLETTQMEINYFIDEILRRIAEGSKMPEVVQNYSKRMTSDPETLTQLVFVDHFRKEIAKKGSTKEAALLMEPRICLNKLKNVEKYLSRHREPAPAPSLQEEDENYDEDVQDNSTPLGDDGSILGLISSDENEVENDLNFKPPESIVIPPDSTLQITNVQSIAHTQQITTPENKSILHPKTKCKYKCKTCTMTFSYKNCSQKHEMRREEDVCPHYPAKKSHSHSEVKPWITNTNVGSMNVTPAKKTFLAKSMYEIDKETGKYVCAVCKKEYTSQNGVHEHYNAFHLKKIHKCETCGAVFRQSPSLRWHKRIYCKRQLAQKKAKESDPRYQFSCEVCGMLFISKKSVDQHRRIVHLKRRKFICDFCSKTFPYLKDMVKHKDAVHLGRTWSCNVCKKQFKWKSSLRKHEKICSTKQVIKTEILTEES